MEELNKTNANPDEWDAMAEQQAEDFVRNWDEAPMRLWDKTARRLAEDFERNITGSWGSPSPSDTEGRQ